jgi:hypothetical protein
MGLRPTMMIGKKLPLESSDPCHGVKVPVAAEKRQGMLAAQRCNPDVIGRNRRSGPL